MSTAIVRPGHRRPPTAPGTLTATGGAGFAEPLVDGGDRQCRRRPLQRPPRDDHRLHAVRGKQGRTADRHEATPTPPPAAGTYFYKVIAQDAAGNVSPASNQASATVTTAVDTTPPTVSLTAPANGGKRVADGERDGIRSRQHGGRRRAVPARRHELRRRGTRRSRTRSAWDTTAASNGPHDAHRESRETARTTRSLSSSVNVTVGQRRRHQRARCGLRLRGGNRDDDGRQLGWRTHGHAVGRDLVDRGQVRQGAQLQRDEQLRLRAGRQAASI